MGYYADPDTTLFAASRKDDIFVDKSGLISFTNRLIGKGRNKICVTRPRRFGKSSALNMLAAYYSCGCSSKTLFEDLQIARDPSFLEHLNNHHVIYLDVQSLWREFGSEEKEDQEKDQKKDQKKDQEKDQEVSQFLSFLQNRVICALKEVFPYPDLCEKSVAGVLKTIHSKDKRNRFIFLVDEWDVIVRDPQVSQQQKSMYIGFLSSIFKGGDIEQCIDMAYMTGILPIIKYIQDTDQQSLLNNFVEYSMIRPGVLAQFMGFTEPEVADLCLQWNMSLDKIKAWYDGYHLGEEKSVYCPESVVMALTGRFIDNYWAGTSGFRVVLDFLRVNLPGLSDAVQSLLAMEPVQIDPSNFMNNVNMISSVDDVLTVLVHYGYLSYEEDSRTVRIPNVEVKREFTKAIKEMNTADFTKLQSIVNDSMRLLEDTWAGNADKVAKHIQKVHNYKTSPINYNNEEALKGVINLAYIAADAYYEMIPELPGGEGYADIAFIPQNSVHKAMILELKWNQKAKTALDQIKARNYQGRLSHYKQILLVGISYEKGTKKGGKKHACKIELWEDPNP